MSRINSKPVSTLRRGVGFDQLSRLSNLNLVRVSHMSKLSDKNDARFLVSPTPDQNQQQSESTLVKFREELKVPAKLLTSERVYQTV